VPYLDALSCSALPTVGALSPWGTGAICPDDARGAGKDAMTSVALIDGSTNRRIRGLARVDCASDISSISDSQSRMMLPSSFTVTCASPSAKVQ
jgi:hypothetical protein